jgi:hypothetical protein
MLLRLFDEYYRKLHFDPKNQRNNKFDENKNDQTNIVQLSQFMF